MGVLSNFFAGVYAVDKLQEKIPAFFPWFLSSFSLTNVGYATTLKHEKIGRFLIGFLMVDLRVRMR